MTYLSVYLQVQPNTRRSSIPKLQKSKIPPSSYTDVHNTGTSKAKPIAVNSDDKAAQIAVTEIANEKTVENNQVLTTVNVNEITIDKEAIDDGNDEVIVESIDDFDQIYEEIMDKTKGIADDNILDTVARVDDVDKVESKFEDLIRDYDENKKQPIKIYKSKIPMVKQKSLHDIKLPKKFHRRFSLNDNDNVQQTDSTQLNAKLEEVAIERKVDYTIESEFATHANANDEAPEPNLINEATLVDIIVTHDTDNEANPKNVGVKSYPIVDISENQVLSENININEDCKSPTENELINTANEINSGSKSTLGKENIEIPNSSLLVRNILRNPSVETIDNGLQTDNLILIEEPTEIMDNVKENYTDSAADTEDVEYNIPHDNNQNESDTTKIVKNNSDEHRPGSYITLEEIYSGQILPLKEILPTSTEANVEIKEAAEPFEIIDISNKLRQVDSEFVEQRNANTSRELSPIHLTTGHRSSSREPDNDEDILKFDNNEERQYHINKTKHINEEILTTNDDFISKNIKTKSEVDRKLKDEFIDVPKETRKQECIEDSNKPITLQEERLPIKGIIPESIDINLDVKEAAQPFEIIDFSNEQQYVDSELLELRNDVQNDDSYSNVHEIDTNTEEVSTKHAILKPKDTCPELSLIRPIPQGRSRLRGPDSNEDAAHVNSVDKRLNHINKKRHKNDEIPLETGRISRLISRLTSQETEQDVPKNTVPVINVSKEQSMSSKIAMFEVSLFKKSRNLV